MVPALGFGIRPRVPRMRPRRPDLAHHLRRGDGHVELEPAALDLGDHVVEADVVGAGLLGQTRAVAFGEDQDAHCLAQACRQQDGAAHLLVGVARVNAQADVHLDGARRTSGTRSA